jgi:four helix bundle protein
MTTLNSHEDLDAWRLATELKEWVFRIIARPQVKRHFKFCDDIGRSSRSAPANLSEGFWRYRPRDNARFVRNALGSLGETQNHLRDAFVEKYITKEEYTAINALNERALKTTVGWHTYLMSCPDRNDSEPSRTQKPNTEGQRTNKKKRTAKTNNQNE